MLNSDEMLFVVNGENEPIEPKPRKEVHANGYWHRNSHVWIKNSGGQILCGQRSLLKDTSPGLWEAFFGGHVLAGESYLATAVKECNEELGLNVKEEDLKFFRVVPLERAKEFVALYKLEWDGDAASLNYEKDEVSQVKWLPLTEVRDIFLSKKEQWNSFGYEKELLNWL